MAKILSLTTGGHQESLDDLIHLQEALLEGQTATFATMGLDFDKAYILKGCEISEDDAGTAKTMLRPIADAAIFGGTVQAIFLRERQSMVE